MDDFGLWFFEDFSFLFLLVDHWQGNIRVYTLGLDST